LAQASQQFVSRSAQVTTLPPSQSQAMAEVCYGSPTTLPAQGTLVEAAKEIMTISDVKSREEVVRILFKLVDAILVSPEDASKRRVRHANAAFQQKVGRFDAALAFLRSVGFLDAVEAAGESVLTMPVAYISRLTDGHHTLAREARQAGLAAPPLPAGSFNPYRASCQTTDVVQANQAPTEWRSAAERLQQEVRQRELAIKESLHTAPPVSLRPSAFWLGAGRKIEDVVKETAVLPLDEAADQALLLSQLANSTTSGTVSQGQFESADKGRLAKLAQMRTHTACVLRIICPDKSVLQVHFRAIETGRQVMARLAPFLAPHVQQANWYLFQSPPVRRLAADDTLASAGLVPGANLYLGFEGAARIAAPFLEGQLVVQLGQRPERQRAMSKESLIGGGKKLNESEVASCATTSTTDDATPPSSSTRSLGSSTGGPPAVSVTSIRSSSKGLHLQKAILSKDKNLKAGFDRCSRPDGTTPQEECEDRCAKADLDRCGRPDSPALLQYIEDSSPAVQPQLFLGWFPLCCTAPLKASR